MNLTYFGRFCHLGRAARAPLPPRPGPPVPPPAAAKPQRCWRRGGQAVCKEGCPLQRDPHHGAVAAMPSSVTPRQPGRSGVPRTSPAALARVRGTGCQLLRGAVGMVALLGRGGPNHRVSVGTWESSQPSRKARAPCEGIFGTARHAFPRASWSKARRWARKVQTKGQRHRGAARGCQFSIHHPWEACTHGERGGDPSSPLATLSTACFNAG